MMKLRDVYSLPAKLLSLKNWCFRSDWFHEIDGLSWAGEEVYSALEDEGRLKLFSLLEHSFDERRYVSMHTIWFDDKPLMFVQNGGREGDDFKRRWITDSVLFQAACTYLRQHLPVEIGEEDLHDPDAEVYPDEVFVIYGSDHCADFGFEVEEKAEGFMLQPHAHTFLPGADPSLIFVEAKPSVLPMPELLRRYDYFMKWVRPVSEEELAKNPRIREHAAASGFTEFHWYAQCERPVGQVVVKM